MKDTGSVLMNTMVLLHYSCVQLKEERLTGHLFEWDRQYGDNG